MKKKYLIFIGFAFATYLKPLYGQELKHLSSFETGTTASAEVVAYDKETKKAVFISTNDNSIKLIDINNPSSPFQDKSISLSLYGAGPNSIAVNNSVIAVAVEDSVKTNNGRVIFFDMNGQYIHQVEVGSLPDMLTFSPDGTKIVVANEGEPNADYSIDPLGTVSVIDIANGIKNASVSTLDFSKYNTKKEYLKNKGVRIFGNNGLSSVAQDMEPEYVAFTPDGKKAYINCQENNAFAVVDLTTNTIIDILPLGYKNHYLGAPKLKNYTLNEVVPNWPVLGTPVYGGGKPSVYLGGFSGLYFDKKASTESNYVFYTIPDRGPNDEPVTANTVNPASTKNLRPYKLPNYQGRIVKFTLNKLTGAISLDDQILLTRKDGITPITGLGNIAGFDEVPVTYTDSLTDFKQVDYTDNKGIKYHQLAYDELGGDFEGILKDKIGNFWACDENRPAIYQFDQTGKLIERFVPKGTSLLGKTQMPEGTYGKETLPSVYSKRWDNRGFEAIAYDDTNNVIYAFIQSPMHNPKSLTSDVIRILGIDAQTGDPVSEFVYLLERNKETGMAKSRIDKIGDAVYKGNGKFLIIERDSEGPGVIDGKKYIFEIDLNFATNILNNPISQRNGSDLTKTLEEMTADELIAENISPVHKHKVLNLPSIGYQSSDKPEGITLLPNDEIAVLNDNDFGIAGAGLTDNSVLGIISFEKNYGFDGSDKDGKTEIKQQKTLGMYLPDAISSFEANGNTYFISANEGDSRDYAGYSEEKRVKDLMLNANYYPEAATLQLEANLGRLKTTTSLGDYNKDGVYEQIYSFGARSFSIFDQYGNIFFDSGNDFEQKTLENEPALYNEDGGKKDGRSDDKGVEPEAITTAEFGDRKYAFIGFERQSAIVMYDITNPMSPEFITYYSNRTVSNGVVSGDVSPEIIKFIPAIESPNGQNMLLVGYEVSGSMGIIQVGETEVLSISEEVKNSNFQIYPNPLVNSDFLNFNSSLSGKIFDINGKQISTFENTNKVNVKDFEKGIYIIKTDLNGTKRFLKM